MKNLLKVSLLVLVSMFILVSCEENEVFTEDALVEEIGIESSTAMQKMVKTEVVLQKSYDENYTLEEAQAQWEKDLSSFKALELSGNGTDWYTSFVIQTGNELNSGAANTYASANVRWHVRTNSNNLIYGSQVLEGELKKGVSRFYLVKNTAEEALASISLQSACISYSSQDNWHVANLKVELRRWDQTHTAVGYSGIYEVVDTWLRMGTYVPTDYYCLDNYTPYESGILYFLNDGSLPNLPTEEIY